MPIVTRLTHAAKRILGYWPNGGGTVSRFAWIEGNRRDIFVPKGSHVDARAWLRAGKGGIRLGVRTRIHAYARVDTQVGSIEIGDDCSVHSFSMIYGPGGVRIGNGVRIAPQAMIIAANHNFDDLTKPIFMQGFTFKGITIEDDVWIGAGAKILDGVTVHTGAVLAAGAVVTKDVPARAVVAGVPARVVRMRGEPRS